MLAMPREKISFFSDKMDSTLSNKAAGDLPHPPVADRLSNDDGATAM